MSQDRGRRAERRNAALTCVLVMVAYFVVPLRPDVSTVRLVARAIGTAAAVIVIGLLVTVQVRREVRGVAGGAASDLVRLAVALISGLTVFALADYVIELTDPGQFAGLRTRIDALYFALSTLTTIGYGDVYAHGQFARIFVMIQMVFSVGVVATGASLLLKQATAGPRK